MKRRMRIQKRLTVNRHDEKKPTFHQRSTQRLIQHLNSRLHFLDAGQDPGKRHNATSLNVNVNLGDCMTWGEMCDKSYRLERLQF